MIQLIPQNEILNNDVKFSSQNPHFLVAFDDDNEVDGVHNVVSLSYSGKL